MSIEEEIANITKDKLGKNLTPEDIMNLFECDRHHILRLIDIKELELKHAKQEYDDLGHSLPQDTKTTISKILNDLSMSLELARLEFEDDKQERMNVLLKDLKLAVCVQRHDIIADCLLDIQSLRECTKDIQLATLERQLKKYSTMSAEDGGDGVIYLDFAYRQEQREDLLARTIQLKYELIALNNLI